MEISKLKALMPKQSAEEVKAKMPFYIDDRMLASVCGKIKDVRWFKIYARPQEHQPAKVVGNGYVVLDNDNRICYVGNKLNPKDSGHNPRYSLKVAFQKINHHDWIPLSSEMTLPKAYAKAIHTERFEHDLVACIRSVQRANGLLKEEAKEEVKPEAEAPKAETKAE